VRCALLHNCVAGAEPPLLSAAEYEIDLAAEYLDEVDGLRRGVREQQVPSMTRSRLDNFKTADGFHPAEQPVINSSNFNNSGRQPRRDASGTIDLSLPPRGAQRCANLRRWQSKAARKALGNGAARED